MKSLDPRVSRLNIPDGWNSELSKDDLDQLDTYEVFIQPKEGRPFQHEGIVHASDEEMAFILAKEQFSRRFTCSGLMVARTMNVFTTDFTENNQTIYDSITEPSVDHGENVEWEVFHLLKRGKQHKHVGSVSANSPELAVWNAKKEFGENGVVYNVWVVKSSETIQSDESEKTIWDTLPDKKFRDAIAYKAGDKIQKFLEEQAKKS